VGVVGPNGKNRLQGIRQPPSPLMTFTFTSQVEYFEGGHRIREKNIAVSHAHWAYQSDSDTKNKLMRCHPRRSGQGGLRTCKRRTRTGEREYGVKLLEGDEGYKCRRVVRQGSARRRVLNRFKMGKDPKIPTHPTQAVIKGLRYVFVRT